MARARAAPLLAKVCNCSKDATPLPLSAVAAIPMSTSATLAGVTPSMPKRSKSAALSAGVGVLPAAVASRRLTRLANASISATVSTASVVCSPNTWLSRARPWMLVATAPSVTPMRW